MPGVLRELSPDQTVVEFGLKVDGGTGDMIAKGTAEISFKATTSWASAATVEPTAAAVMRG